jgi:transposase
MPVRKPLNRYARRARITEARFRRLIRFFALDFDAGRVAILCRLNRNTVNRYLLLIRILLAEVCERPAWVSGVVEVDESYFGARRARGKPGRGAGGKTPVFGIFERGGQVFTEILADCSKPSLQALIMGRVSLLA